MTSLRTAAQPDSGAIERLAALIETPEMIRSLGERLDRLNAVQEELSAGLRETLKRTKAPHQGIQRLGDDLADVREALVALADKQECLELASKQQAILTEDHFNAHVVDPIASTLFELIDFCADFQNAADDSDQAESLRVFASKIHGVLAGMGIRTIDIELGEPVDPQFMKVVSYQRPCTDPDADKTVAHIRKQGFRRGRRILRHAEVELFRFKTPRAGSRQLATLNANGE